MNIKRFLPNMSVNYMRLNHNLTTGSKDSCAEQENKVTFVKISKADDYDTINNFYFTIYNRQS